MDLGYAGKKALVTGASRGIGRAVAESLAREGCNLSLVARNQELLDAAARDLSSKYGVQVEVLAMDMRAPDAIGKIAERFGGCDILVNNAGDMPHGALDAFDEEKLQDAWRLKLFGYIELTRKIYGAMKARQDGVIVNIIGIVGGERVSADYITGSAGNAALSAFTRALGASSPADGVRVVAVHPGLIMTDRQIVRWRERARQQLGDAERWLELTAPYPFGRLGKPAEVADAVAFMASPVASYISGTSLTVDGGYSQKLTPPRQN
jgi:hypothetical protein